MSNDCARIFVIQLGRVGERVYLCRFSCEWTGANRPPLIVSECFSSPRFLSLYANPAIGKVGASLQNLLTASVPPCSN